MDIQKIAIESAEKYHQFATEKKKSLIEHSIRKITHENAITSLHLFSPIASTEGLQIRIDDVLYDDQAFKIVEYDKDHLCLRLILQVPLDQIMARISPEKVHLLFDLRFLIQRVKSWYEDFGNNVAIPKKSPAIPLDLDSLKGIHPSEDQKEAIQGILSSPLSYVWGAPGTGKTQVVLAASILHCLKNGKKVLLTAPTNRAVEQILFGVLPILETAGISQDVFLRMGTPTKEFASQYPNICENTQLQRKLEEINALIQIQTGALNENEQLLKTYSNYKDDLFERERFEEAAKEIRSILLEMKSAVEQKKKEKEAEQSFEENYNLTKERIERNAEQQTIQKQKIRILSKQLKRSHSFLYRKLFAVRTEEIQKEFDEATTLLDDLAQKETELMALAEKYYKAYRTATEKYESACAFLRHKSDSVRAYRYRLRSLNLPNSAFAEMSTIESIQNFEALIQKGMDHFDQLFEKYGPDAAANYRSLKFKSKQIQEEIINLNNQLKHLKEQSSLQMNRCRVLATTLDLALIRVKPNDDFRPDHVFLDEAGYAPLIKAAPLTAYRCPLTLLGDHMQLPPVCEMSEEDIGKEENALIALWTQSALYIEDFFLKEYPMLYQRFLGHDAPFFRFMQKYDLTHSYRFGNNLASILAGSVYAENLTGNDEVHTELCFINAPRKLEQKGQLIKRQNLSECDAIAQFIEENEGLEIGVITPYRNQKEALKKRLPDLIEVNTVHGSQGREWDCVILSVVDTTDRFFTDSNLKISNGKKIINTAVSRAKKKLILVCDASYWSTQKNQLIGKILSISKEIQ